MGRDWYSSWFDTSYYHILYKDRDYSEAELFIDNLIEYLNPPLESKILDLACGKGRHSIYLSKKGYIVSGCDLSSNSINEASKYRSNRLSFFKHDMRNRLNENYHLILNLFTSFGYFEDTDDNYKILQSVYNALPQNGFFVLDYLNANKVVSSLLPSEKKVVDGITFNIQKEVDHGFIKKLISFKDKGEAFQYQEKVQLLTLSNFNTMFHKVGMKIEKTFGSYNLNDFDENNSDRLIIVAKKSNKL